MHDFYFDHECCGWALDVAASKLHHPEVAGTQFGKVVEAFLAAANGTVVHVILALDEAHGHLVNARAVAAPPPSDRWYCLLDQFVSKAGVAKTACDRPLGLGKTGALIDLFARDLLIAAAAFLAAEANDLEDRIELLASDRRQKRICALLDGIADKASGVTDVLLGHIDDQTWREFLELEKSELEKGRRLMRSALQTDNPPRIAADATPSLLSGDRSSLLNTVWAAAVRVEGSAAEQSGSRARAKVQQGVKWRALGPVEAVVAGRRVDLGPPKQRALFGLLLSRMDRPVALDEVIEELWPGSPRAAAMTSVRAYVSNLRRVLEPDRPPRAPATVLRTRAPGYLLDSQGVDVDVHRFTEHAFAGREALGRADPEHALIEFDAALGLWRGPAYADLADARWAAPEVARLEELRLSVIEARCAAQLALGENHGAATELEIHVQAHPLREHSCELLALALYRAGRQAEALGVLRVIRARLAEELGIDPCPALQRLERDILLQAPALDWYPPKPTSGVPVVEAITGLQARAEAGDTVALWRAADLLAKAGRTDEAITWLQARAEAGDTLTLWRAGDLLAEKVRTNEAV